MQTSRGKYPQPDSPDDLDKILWPHPYSGKPYQVTVSGKVGEPVYNLGYTFLKAQLSEYYTNKFLEIVNNSYKDVYYVKGDNPIETADKFKETDRYCEIRDELRAELRQAIKNLNKGANDVKTISTSSQEANK